MSTPKVAIIIANLGTPEAPTPQEVKPFLKEFLSDPRVIEVNPLMWKFVLNVMILPRRAKASAKRYEKIWTKQGSPLIVHTKKLAEKLSAIINPYRESVLVDYAMRYGKPSLAEVIPELHKKGIEKILLVPLYPQFSATTTATVMDMACDTLKTMRSQPELRVIRDYHNHPAYIKSIARSIKNLWSSVGELPKDGKLILSFHGMPVSYCKRGDPYRDHVMETTKLVGEELGTTEPKIMATFQSIFGNELWLEPYTGPTLRELAEKGTQRVDIICPGFAVDCLETLEEINIDYRKVFLDAGGKQFNYINCLNSGDEWAKAMAEIITPHLSGWI